MKRKSKRSQIGSARDHAATPTGIPRELKRVQIAASKRYGRYPNVVGISAGTKYSHGAATDDHASLQFFVRKKIARQKSKEKTLPRFVYGRFRNGKINRRIKFKTDVIEVGHVRGSCGSGSSISGRIGLSRQNGRITIAFQNKAPADNNFYVVSCAHVLGDIDGQSSSPIPVLQSQCSESVASFGTTVFSSKQQDEIVEFDIALARVNSECLPLPDLEIAVDHTKLRSFMGSDAISLDLPVSCALPVSNAKTGIVSSGNGSITVEYRRGAYEVENAWLFKANRRVKGGDSGGLIYHGDEAVGVVFASSDSAEGWAWFHPLVDAFEFVKRNVSIELRCF